MDEIFFHRIQMDHVMTPLVVNCFYFCDPDGHTTYVQQREGIPADERTPDIRKLAFKEIECTGCEVQAAYIEGLPEKMIDELVLENVSFSFAENAASGEPAMTEGAGNCSKKGFFASNVKTLLLRDVAVHGQEGQDFIFNNIQQIEQE